MEALLPKTLDRESQIPLYDQIRRIILNAIQSSDLQEGDRLPNERLLQSIYDVSRSTIRQALTALESDGYIQRVQGSGTRVVNRSPRDIPKVISSFTQDILEKGLNPSSRTLTVQAVHPPDSVSTVFKIEPDASVWYVRRLRLADDNPIALNDLYIPPHFAFLASDLNNMLSYYKLLDEKYNVHPRHAVDRVSAGKANARQAESLKINTGDTLILLERYTYTENNDPLEYTYIYFIPEFFEYKIFLHMPKPEQHR